MIASFKRWTNGKQDGSPLDDDEPHSLLDSHSSLRRLGQLLLPHGRRISIVLGMLFGLVLVNLAPPFMLKVLVDEVFANGRILFLWMVLAGFLTVYIARQVLFFNSKFKIVQLGENVAFSLRKRLFEQLQQMSLKFYRQNNPGKVSSRVMNDSFVVQQFIQDTLPTLLQSTLMFLGLVAFLYAINWPLAIVATVVLPLHLFAFYYFRRPIKEASKVAQHQLAVVHGNLIEKFLGMEVVKGFGAERREKQQFQQAIGTSRDSQLRSQRYHVWQKVIADVLVGIGTMSLIGFGAYQVIAGHMKTGDFLAFHGYVLMLYPTVGELMSSFAKMTRATACIDRVFELLDHDETEPVSEDPVFRAIRGDIEFHGVGFGYDDAGPVLDDVNLTIPAGQVCAIVGPSGAGKSTLVNLVPRFLDPNCGQVMVDGVDVRRYDLQHLRSSIGIAFQECFLFNASIFENLRYARPDATMRQIIDTARYTGAHEFITKLPDGYQTRVGENGVTLSRGEMQRITLTRAMLKNPRILILDEATASIDAASQDQIIPAIRQFMRGKTTLMITHNPDLIRHADVVVQLVDGRIEFTGPPDADAEDMMRTGVNDALNESPFDPPPAPDQRDPEASGTWPTLRLLLVGVLMGLMSYVATPALAQDARPAPKQTPKAAPPAKQPAAQPKPAPKAPPKPAPKPAPKPQPKAQPAISTFIPMPGLNRIEVEELIDVAITRLSTQHGYTEAGDALAANLTATPEGVHGIRTLARQAPGGLRMIRIGYKTFRSQPPHIYVHGLTLADGAQPKANADISAVEKHLAEGRKALDKQYATVAPRDLATSTLTLSYIEADRCLGMLKTLGYQTVEYKPGGKGLGKEEIVQPSGNIDVKKLPVIVSMPGASSTDLVGGTGGTKGAFGLTMTPSLPTSLPARTSAAPVMDLMVMYHPAHPEQFSEVVDRIRKTIDVPAKQILIEAMVLEISETGLKELGVKWELNTPFNNEPFSNVDDIKLGRLPDFATGDEPTLDISINDVFGHFNAQLQALIRNGQAEILSRPSVLTLDNRQASLRVGREIPVATSASGLRGGDRISFQFSYIPVGILLNVRPRIAADDEEVSMQIDGIVSAEVPGEELIIRDAGGDILAEAPTIATRRVQTYGRIANNTPFIIGGLVEKDMTSVRDKVPLLGDLPVVGGAFRSDEVRTQKREVIIVITPYVLPDNRTVGRNMPKDEDAFDSFGNKLFRDAYRIRAEDVFDLGFIFDNPQLREMKRLAGLAVSRNYLLAGRYPFNRFTGNRVPGERILVYRQMYEVIKRLRLDDRVTTQKMIFFKPDPEAAAGFDVTFLWEYLNEIVDAPKPGLFDDPDDPAPLFDALQATGKALALTYTSQHHEDLRNMLDQPVPRVMLIDCADRKQWEQLMWRMNQSDEQGRPVHTILLQDEDDLTRLKRAVLLKRVVQLNANRQALTMTNFSIGRLLLMPTVKENKVYLVDDQVAMYFFYTDLYYPALQKELNRDLIALRNALQLPEIYKYLDSEPIPQPDPFVPRIHLRPLKE